MVLFSYINPKIFIWFIFCSVFVFSMDHRCIAQQSKMDSLFAALKTAKEDTNKVNLLFQVSEEQVPESPDILKYAQQSLALAEKLNYKKGIANALNNIGYAYDMHGQIEKALECHMKSLKISESVNYKNAIASSLINIGYIYSNQEQYEKALEYYTQALKLGEELKSFRDNAVILGNIGRIYTKLGQNEKALEYCLKAFKIQEEINDKRGIATSLTTLGTFYQNDGQMEKALDYFLKSLKIREELKDTKGIAYSLTYIGSHYFKQKDYVKAEDFCRRALNQANSPETIINVSKHLSEIYVAQGKYKQAFEMQLLFKQMSDSINNQETQKASVRKQMQYEFEKKEVAVQAEQDKKDAIVLEERQMQKIILWSVFSGFLLVIIFSGFILNRWRITQRQKKIIETQKALVDQRNLKITDSISYAQRIQEAILPKDDLLKNLFSDSFIFFRPKDIVSGDFYWVGDKGNKKIFTVVDCTGHGIPGAFMSMIGNTLLNEIVNDEGIEESDKILNCLKEKVIHSLKQSEQQGVNDGMDLALCVLDKSNNILNFSGARNSLYHIRNNVLTEYRGDKQSIGFERGKGKPFTKYTIEVQKGDTIYLFSDGFVDQKGGKEERKFYYAPFQQLISSIQQEPMDKQREILITTFNEWKGNLEQIDDVLVMGVRI